MTGLNIPDKVKVLGVHWWDGSNHEAFEMDGVRLIVAAELERLRAALKQRGDQRDQIGDDDGVPCEEAGSTDAGDCHTVAAVATWYRAADLLERRASELRGED